MNIGFIGTGVMGAAIAHHLLDAGYVLNVFNRTQWKTDPLVERGAVWRQSPQEVAENSDLVFTMVGGPEDVADIYRRADGVFAGAKTGQIVVDLTTSTPTLAEELYTEGLEIGVHVLDAPVSGGDVGAQQGILSIMIGGEKPVFEQILPILSHFGKTIEHIGEAGKGQHLKVANQIMGAATNVGTGEILAYAQAAGLNLEQTINIVGQGASANFSFNNYAPRVIRDDFEPGFYVHLLVKDLGIALDEAEKLNLELPATSLAQELYQRLMAEGHADKGVQAIAKLWFDHYR